ncbi:MAG: hypothetical protein M1825_004554 [Sarcosagium campestre]|nr:MAG: hypothetical protein M1825_004554 [Sarcosagium campestre]
MTTNVQSRESYTSAPTSQVHLYGGQQLSPVNSAQATPIDASPKEARSSEYPIFVNQTRQIRPPKCPLYRPAVLRPTERSLKQSPPTPPHSSSNSIDSLKDNSSPQTISRRSTSDSSIKMGRGLVYESDWMGYDSLGKVTGPPTRDHWKPDSRAFDCDAAMCSRSFNLFERRHHCRRCGNVFCASHTPFLIPLDHHARFHPDGLHSRACDHCWTDYKEWETARCNRSNSMGLGDELPTPTVTIAGSVTGSLAGLGREHGDQKVGSVAGSVPRDWTWSTF